MQEVSLKVL